MLWYLMSSQIQSWVKTTIMPKKWYFMKTVDKFSGKMIFMPGMKDWIQSAWKDWWQLKISSVVGMINYACLANLDHLKSAHCKDYKFIHWVNTHKCKLPTVLQYIIIHFLFYEKNPFSKTKLMISYSLYLLFLNKNIIQIVVWQPHICSTPYDPMTG